MMTVVAVLTVLNVTSPVFTSTVAMSELLDDHRAALGAPTGDAVATSCAVVPPATVLLPEGLVTEIPVGETAVTVILSPGLVTDVSFILAVITVSPMVPGVSKPFESIVATDVSLLTHVTERPAGA